MYLLSPDEKKIYKMTGNKYEMTRIMNTITICNPQLKNQFV